MRKLVLGRRVIMLHISSDGFILEVLLKYHPAIQKHKPIQHGYAGQDDSAIVSIEFKNSACQIIGNPTTIGPVLNIDRGEMMAVLNFLFDSIQ